ncbi:unnamed protein product [Urochloa decumbens]|uniref:Uncharacterized protein n=1 Tax=Urochloa decumbens TaxID=240449 RepID=A0ABC8ZDN2_9POAL
MASITSKEQGGSKVFSKLFSRESSAAAPSFRVYYGVASAGSVPFLWESQPGTPKNDAVSATTLPPLTPPPSYYTARQHHKSAAAANSGAGKVKHSKPKHQYTSIFSAILPKLILHRRSRSSSSSVSGGSPSAASTCSSSSSSSSAFSSSAASSASFRSVQSPAAACSSMRSRVYAFSAGDAAADSEDERPAAAAPTCFSGVRHESFRAFKGCRVAMTVKSALTSVGGHGHGPTAAQKV